MTKTTTRKNLTVAGVVVSIIGAILVFGLNCMNAELSSKVDKELYRSEQTNLVKTVDKIDDRVFRMEVEQNRQGRVQERIAGKLGVEIE